MKFLVIYCSRKNTRYSSVIAKYVCLSISSLGVLPQSILLIQLKSLEALQEIAKGDANKVFIPFEATNTLSSLGAIKEVIKDK